MIQIDKLTVTEGRAEKKKFAFSDLSLEVAPGECYVLLSADPHFSHALMNMLQNGDYFDLRQRHMHRRLRFPLYYRAWVWLHTRVDRVFLHQHYAFKGTIRIDGHDWRSHLQARNARVFEIVQVWSDYPDTMKLRDLIDLFRRCWSIPDEAIAETFLQFNIDAVGDRPGRGLFRALKSFFSDVHAGGWSGKNIKTSVRRFQAKMKGGPSLADLDESLRRFILLDLARLKGCKNFIIHDLAKGMAPEFITSLRDKIAQMKREGCSILYLSDDVFIAPEIGDRIDFVKGGLQVSQMTAHKMQREDLKDLHFRFMVG